MAVETANNKMFAPKNWAVERLLYMPNMADEDNIGQYWTIISI